jgi:hypothetical protein
VLSAVLVIFTIIFTVMLSAVFLGSMTRIMMDKNDFNQYIDILVVAEKTHLDHTILCECNNLDLVIWTP